MEIHVFYFNVEQIKIFLGAVKQTAPCDILKTHQEKSDWDKKIF